MTPDFAALAAIHAEGFDRPWTADELKRLAALDGTVLVTAPGERSPAGFILLQCVLDEAEILTIAVKAAERGKGVGKSLLAAGEAQVRERGVRKLFLDVSHRNTAGLALYRAAGYRETGRRRAYYSDGSDALLMEKALPGLDGAERSA